MKCKVVMILAVMLVLGGIAQAVDSVTVAVYNKTAGALIPDGGNIYTHDVSDNPQSYQVQINVKNDLKLGGISMGFRTYSADGVTWTWDAQAGGWGEGCLNQGFAAITSVTGSRMDPIMSVWDLGGLLVRQKSTDGANADSILIGGVALSGGMLAGPLQHVLSIHFTPGGVNDGDPPRTLCIDTAYMAPGGDFIFSYEAGGNSKPKFPPAMCYSVTKYPSDVSEAALNVPHTFSLSQNRPNPFNPTTVIDYSLARKSQVDISVFNILGQKVVTLVSAELDAGPHQAVWDGKDTNGQQVASGVYFYKMDTDQFVQTRKMALMR